MTRARMARSVATLLVLALVAGCGGSSSSSDTGSLRKKVEARFAQEGVRLYEAPGFYGPGDDLQLAPGSRATFGDFVVHVVKNAHGFEVAEAGAGQPDADGIRWDDALAQHNPPYFTSLKRYGDSLELQWSTQKRSTDQPQWHRLDAIMRELAG